MGLRKEWRNITQMIKTRQSFDVYFVGDLYNLLKSHESKIKDIAEEWKMSLGGPMDLMSKVA